MLFCTNSKLSRDEYYEWQTQNLATAKHQYLLKDKLGITYEAETCMEIAMDISKFLSQEHQIKVLFENEQIWSVPVLCRIHGTTDKQLSRHWNCLGKKLKGDRTYIFEIHDLLMDNIYELQMVCTCN